MRQSINTFSGGLSTDSHPLSTNNTTLMDAINVELVTTTSNQFILQKRVANDIIIYEGDQVVALTDGYVPLAVETLNNIAYIVSYNKSEDKVEIGSFPSPHPLITEGQPVEILKRYSPFMNFYNGFGDITTDASYTFPFRTSGFKYNEKSVLDIELQFDYDDSVNVIIASDTDVLRIINSRFIVDEHERTALLANRRPDKDSNTYSEESIHRTTLIPTYKGVPKLVFNGVDGNGILKAGGYRYYFRYMTSEFLETNIIEESRIVEVHAGNDPHTAYTPKDDGITNVSVQFTLEDLDNSYPLIRVYYTYFTGSTQSVSTYHMIDYAYKISGTKSVIIHSGYEDVTDIDSERLGVSYIQIEKCTTTEASNGRLLVGNTSLVQSVFPQLAENAAAVKIEEGSFIVKHANEVVTYNREDENYGNPYFSYYNTGYWRGETYELGVVYITEDGLTPVFPLHGIDNLDGTTAYDPAYVGDTSDDFFPNGQNSKGVYRTSGTPALEFGIVTHGAASTSEFKGVKLQIDPSPLLCLSTSLVMEDVGSMLTVAHDPETPDNYFLYGVGNMAIGLIGIISVLPSPSVDIFFTAKINNVVVSAIKLSPSGELSAIVDIPPNTNFSERNSAPPVVEGVVGFFIVRKTRKKDKIAQGLLTPTATVPTRTTYFASLTVATKGDKSGVGTTFKPLNSDVTFIPCAQCILPFATEWHGFEQTPGSGTFQVEMVDLLVKAPVRDYGADESYAFYSPDVDTQAAYSASLFNGSKKSINVFTGDYMTCLYTKLSYDHSPALSSSIPTGFRPGSAVKVDGASISSIASMVFVGAGTASVASMSFSAATDRNLSIYLHDYLSSESGLGGLMHYVTNDPSADPFNDEEITIGVPAHDGAIRTGNTPSSIVKYGTYLGIRSENSLDPVHYLNYFGNPQWTIDGEYSGDPPHDTLPLVDQDTPHGFVANIFDNTNGKELERPAWESRYIHNSSAGYSAISKRYSISDFVPGKSALDLYGGDCYVGMYLKQYLYSAGIAEAPQVTDPLPYVEDRTALGLAPHGLSIAIPAQSNTNFNIRTIERFSDTDYKIFGKDRSFLPIKTVIRGERLQETALYNFGFSDDANYPVQSFRLDPKFPYTRFQYSNRVYASEIAVTEQFLNGFTSFKDLVYKDYNSELGPLTKIQVLGDYTFLIMQFGVVIVGIDERNLLSGSTGGVVVDNSDILAKKSKVISSTYGSQHLDSVVVSTRYIYGVDIASKKIWRVSNKGFEVISDARIQTKLAEIIEWLTGYFGTHSWKLRVYSSFDVLKNDIYFTFTATNYITYHSRTLVYNELLNIWVTETDDTRRDSFLANGIRLSFPTISGTDPTVPQTTVPFYQYKGETDDYKPDYNRFFGTIFDTRYEYVVVDNPSFGKLFSNQTLIGNNTKPTAILYETDKLHNTHTQDILPMSNETYKINNVTASGYAGKLFVSLTPSTDLITKYTGEKLQRGDVITIYDGITYMSYIVMDHDPHIILLDNPLATDITDAELFIGYRTNFRLSNAIYESNLTKIMLQFNGKGENMSEFRPEGKWMKINNILTGIAPMYLSTVLTYYTQQTS